MADSGSRGAIGTAKGGKVKIKGGAKSIAGTAAAIPFKSGFRTARGQKAFATRGGKNVAAPGTQKNSRKAAKAAAKAGKPKAKGAAKKKK